MHIEGFRTRPQVLARQRFVAPWRRAGLYAGRTVAEELRAGIQKNSETRLVFSYESQVEETTSGALWDEAGYLVKGLADLGLKSGDVVACQLPNCRENVVLFLAAMRLGLIIVPIVHIYGVSELGSIQRAAEARCLVLPTQWGKIDFAARIDALTDLPHLEFVVVIGDKPTPSRCLPWRQLTAVGQSTSSIYAGDPDGPCMINFTSGTTSAPKGVVHSHHSLLAAACRHPSLGIRASKSPYIRFGPAGHVAAIMSLPRPFLFRDETVFVDSFNAEVVAALCDRYGASRMNGVPAHILALMDVCDGILPVSMQFVLLGATSIPPSLVEKLHDMRVSAVRTWGSTEQPVITCGDPADSVWKQTHTDGRPLRDNIVRAVDEDGREVASGTPGELVTIGPQMFLGYLDASLDKHAFAADGSYRCVDILIIDSEGFVTIVDRKKDIVERGGEKISSREIEEVLLAHPSVRDAAVIGWPDERLGERVGAFIELSPGSNSLTLGDVQKLFTSRGMARQKTPEQLVIVDELPRTPAGKIAKASLRSRIKLD